MEDRVRIYGKEVNTWWETDERGRRILRQVELEYTEYNPDTGEVKAVGTEDFSRERYRVLVLKLVWTWDGKRRNAGGKRWFDYEGKAIRYARGQGKKVKKVVRFWYPDAAEVELR